MRRRRKLSLMAMALLLLGAGVLVQVPYWSARLLERGLTAFLGRPSKVSGVRFRLWPAEVEITGVVVEGRKPGSAPFLEVPRAILVPSLESPRLGRISLTRLRLEGPVVRIHAFQNPPNGPGGDDLPSLGSGSRSGGPSIRLGRLIVNRGVLELDHERVPLDLDLPDFRLRLGAGPSSGLAGRLSFDEGTLRFGDGPVLPVGAEIALRVAGPMVYVDDAHLRARGTDLAFRGRLGLRGRPQGQFAIEGPIDLEVLDRHVIRSSFKMAAAARYAGVLLIDGSLFRFEGNLSGLAGRFDGLPVDTFTGNVVWDQKGTSLRQLDLTALSGTATLDIDIPSGDQAVHLVGKLNGIDTEGLVAWVFSMGSPGLGGAATGELDLTWPRKRPRALSGRIAADLVGLTDGRTPLAGRFEWDAESGAQRIRLADLRTPRSHVRLQGRISVENEVDVAVAAESRDLAEADAVLTGLRRALGSEEAQPARVSGVGTFVGRWAGTLVDPEYSGRFTGGDIEWGGVLWGRADWAGRATGASIHSRSLVLRKEGAELWLDGVTGTGYYGAEDQIDASARLTEWPAEDLVRALDLRLDVTGALSGEVTARGRRSAPQGKASLSLSKGAYSGVPLDSAHVDLRWGGAATEVVSGEASFGGGHASFQGTLSDDGVYDGRATAESVEIETLVPPLAEALRPAGRISGTLTLLGPLSAPRLEARLTSPRIFLGDEGLGAFEATLTGRGDGQIRVEARTRSARMDLAATAALGATPPHSYELRLTAREASLDPFARAFWTRLPPTLGLVASGRAEVSGSLLDPSALRVRATLPGLVLNLPEYALRAAEPLVAELSRGRLHVKSFHLAGEGTDLTVEGSLLLAGEGSHSVSVRGAADLRAVSALSRSIRGRGSASLGATLTGTTSEPRIEGTLEVENGGLRFRGFPHGLEDVRGRVTFSERAAQIHGLEGTLAGGPVDIEGEVTYSSGRLTGMDLRPTGRSLTLRYPEGLRSVVDADLRIFGDDAAQWITGTVDVDQAVWTRRYDLASELLAGGGGLAPTVASLDDTVHLDLQVRAPGTLRIDNNLASLTARADLAVQGTVSAPIILGRAEIDRGKVYFQGQNYLIRRGKIDFANPDRIDPLFDIEAETRVRSYTVTLAVNGSLGRVTPTLSSDPPLAPLQILNLLAGADESVVTSLAQAQIGKAQLAATGAATLAAGRLSEQMGLERGAEKVFGLNRFSIDPTLLRGSGTTPTARLTVGKRLTSDLSILYTQDLRGTEERILSIEYSLSDRFSVILERADPDGLAVDVRLRHQR